MGVHQDQGEGFRKRVRSHRLQRPTHTTRDLVLRLREETPEGCEFWGHNLAIRILEGCGDQDTC